MTMIITKRKSKIFTKRTFFFPRNWVVALDPTILISKLLTLIITLSKFLCCREAGAHYI